MRIKMPAVRIAQADVEMQQQHSDVLTCGACQKPFALGDIVKFIQHKVLACNKENYSCDPSGPLVESGDSDDGGIGVVNSRRPSISAPMKKASLGSTVREGRVLCTSPEGEGDRDPRCSTPKRSGRPPLPLNLEAATDEDESKRADSTPPHSSPDEGPSKRLRTEMSDAQSNTTNSEPSNYVCSTCKARLHSAWRLVQHVQNNHGMKIYVDPTTTASSSSVTSSPGTSSNAGKNQSGSSTCSTSSSGCSSSGNPAAPATPLSLGAPPRLGIPSSSPMVEPPIPLHNPFTVGGILRLPMEPPRHHQFPPSSLGNSSGSLFARPSSHNEHHFRMDQLVSEQFRLSQHHAGLNLAAAVAAASRVPPPHTSFGPPPGDRPSPILPPASVARSPVAPPPPALGLSLEPQLDFYSQRLRQLAGTTSPGPNSGGNSSPSSRKLTPPFTSPNSSLQPPASLPPAVLNNNNNNNSTNNNNINSQSPSPRACSRSPSVEPKSQPEEPSSSDLSVKVEAPTTPRSSASPPSKPADFSMTHQPENMEIGDSNKIHACDYCGKKFRFQSNLLVHRRSHTGEKPFKCSVCNHACSQSSKLKRHMRVHRRSMTSGNDEGNPNGNTSANSNNEHGSNEGSIGTMEDDDDEDDDEEDMEEDDDDEEEEDEDEEMELEDEEGDEDDDIGGDAPEDLTTKSNSSTSPTAGEHKGATSPHNMDKVPSGSLVGEFMDKYGLSNIQQYSEAYKQALKESVGAHHIMRKEDLIHRSHLLSDNNNCKPPHRLGENGLLEKSAAALRFREEFAKNMMSGQPPLDLVAGHPGLFGSPFENPFEASKRLKMERDGCIGRGERDSLYPSMWLPAMAAHHREQMFGGNGSESDIMKDNCKGGSPGTSASLAAAAAAAAALNLGLPTQSMKKESRRNDTCEYCGKVFKNCSNLTVHRRSHTGEKPYKCELCSYACAQSSKLTRHMKTHGRMGKDVYRCRFCEMPFSVPSTLEKHMRKCVVNQNIKVDHMMPSMLGGDSNIKVEHMLPMMTSGDEDSVASMPKDAATT